MKELVTQATVWLVDVFLISLWMTVELPEEEDITGL